MKPKIIKKISLKDNPYHIFSTEKNSHTKSNYLRSLNRRIIDNENNKIRLLTNYEKQNSDISSYSKSLKSVALNSKLYGNYIDYYSNITQEHSFKTPRVNKYPLLKNKKYLSIKLQPLTERNSNKDKISFSTDISNSIFLSYTKDIKPVKKIIEIKPYGFKYGRTRIRFDRSKTTDSFTAGKDFRELCDINLFESKFLKQIGIKKIDMNNCYEEKQKNFKFFCEYLKKVVELKDIFNQKNIHRNIMFNGRTAIKKENIEYKLDIYSLCLKFFSMGNNKENQKLYFPFILMPIFYLLDFTSFKVLLSEIITFNKNDNCFEYIEDNLFIQIIKKYINYIYNSLENKQEYVLNITYNKKETIFPLIYDWIVIKNYLNEEEDKNINKYVKDNFQNNYRCYKLKIVLPKIKFYVDNLNIKINKFLNKHIIANLLQNKFNKWEKYIFFDLFSTKRFKIITNLIMLNKYYEIPLKKIKLNRNYKIKNKDYEFFMTQIGENHSLYYTFIPFIILTLFEQKGNKKFQKLNLTLKDSININKFGKNWGIINTLFKCMFIDKMTNKINFKFELLEDDNNELFNVIKEENNNNNNSLKIGNLNEDINSNDVNSNFLTINYNMTEKENNKIPIKYKDRMIEILLQDCTFRKIEITSNSSEDKYYMVPQNILDNIFNIEDKNKIFNINYTDISLISKYIGENSKSILTAKESNNVAEEKKMMDETDSDDDVINFVMTIKENTVKKEQPKQNIFNKLNIFKIVQNNNEEKKEIKKENKVEIVSNNIIAEKRRSSKFIFPKGIFTGRSEKKKVSITNMNELNQNRFNNITRDIIKRRTLSLKKYN